MYRLVVGGGVSLTQFVGAGVFDGLAWRGRGGQRCLRVVFGHRGFSGGGGRKLCSLGTLKALM